MSGDRQLPTTNYQLPLDHWASVTPMLAISGGVLWLMSTPHGKPGFFYEAWAKGGSDWTRISVAATDCPRIKKSFLEQERRRMGDRWFRQEYLCEFHDTRTQLISDDYLDRIWTDRIPPLKLN